MHTGYLKKLKQKFRFLFPVMHVRGRPQIIWLQQVDEYKKEIPQKETRDILGIMRIANPLKA
jgi:hypothetical protein